METDRKTQSLLQTIFIDVLIQYLIFNKTIIPLTFVLVGYELMIADLMLRGIIANYGFQYIIPQQKDPGHFNISDSKLNSVWVDLFIRNTLTCSIKR